MLGAWVFIILMFVKVEQQCWLADKYTRGITVTKYTAHSISIWQSSKIATWPPLQHTIGRGQSQSIEQLIIHKQSQMSIICYFNNFCIDRAVESRRSVVPVRCCIRVALYSIFVWYSSCLLVFAICITTVYVNYSL